MFAASKTSAAAAGAPPGPSTDPQFNYVTMLLHGDGTNGAQNNTFVDSSTNNFTITRNGTPTQGSFSPYGDLWSNQFKGTTDYLTVGGGMPSGQGTEFTLEFWAFVPTAGVNVFTEGSGSGTLDFYVESNGTVKLDNTGVANILATASGAFQFGTWVHVALTRTTGNLYTLYINGVSVASGTNSTSYTANTTIGWHRNTASAYFKGYLSNWRVTNTRVYTSAFTPSTTPLTAVSGTSLLTCQSNRFRDNSSNNFAITVTGTPSVQRFSPFDPAAEYSTSVIGGSAYFKGSTDFLTLVDNAIWDLPGDFTVECFVYMIGAQNDKNFIVQYPGGTGGLSFGTFNSGNRLQFGAAGVAYDVTSTNAIPVYQWVHVAAVRSGTSLKLYINGVNDGTATQSRTYGGSAPLAIGGNSGSAAQCFLGYISDARIVKGTAVYTAAFTPPTAPLTAITNTSLLLNTVNAGIFDNAMMNDLVTVGNAQVSTAVKKYGTGSLAFDGSGDWLIAPPSNNFQLGAGNFTIEFWVYFNNTSANMQIINTGTPTSSNLSFALYKPSGTAILYYLSSNGTSWNIASGPSVGTVAAGAWYHIALVRNGTTFTPYVNGIAGTTTTSSSALFAAPSLGIGNQTEAPSAVDVLNGYIDDLRITKGIARYTANFTPPTAAFPNN